jgi:hypothetical protein
MTKKLLTATFFLVLLGFAMVGSVKAQTRIPGVYQGNVFTYDVTASWSSNDPNAVVPADLLDINKTEYYQVTITAVSGSEITTQSVWHFTNGTETTSSGTINVETGATTDEGFWLIAAGNLGVNDRLQTSGPNYFYVNTTVMRDYVGGARETNQLTFTLPGSDVAGDFIEYVDYYFDKQTGMLVQLNDAKVYSNPTTTITRFWKIKDSNVWVVPEFPSALIMPLLMAITMLALIVYKKKHAGSTKTLIPAKARKF